MALDSPSECVSLCYRSAVGWTERCLGGGMNGGVGGWFGRFESDGWGVA